MTDEKINAAIAEACGWKDVDACTCPEICLIGLSPHGNYMHVPNYCADLNAMHEAERVLTKDRNSYLTTLAGLVEVDHLRGLDADWPWVCATARQRAEAFLKVLGKWEE